MEWLEAYALTQGIEAPIYAWALREKARAEQIVLAFLPSALTHPLLWFLFWPLTTSLAYAPRVAFGEVLVWLAEALVVAPFLTKERRWQRALGWSLAANGVSVLVGLMVS